MSPCALRFSVAAARLGVVFGAVEAGVVAGVVATGADEDGCGGALFCFEGEDISPDGGAFWGVDGPIGMWLGIGMEDGVP